MKRIFAFALLCLMCVSLVACGGAQSKSTQEAIIGSWVCEEDASTVQINNDHTGSVSYDDGSISFTWKYDEATRILLASVEEDNFTEALTYIEVDDILYADGFVYTRVK